GPTSAVRSSRPGSSSPRARCWARKPFLSAPPRTTTICPAAASPSPASSIAGGSPTGSTRTRNGLAPAGLLDRSELEILWRLVGQHPFDVWLRPLVVELVRAIRRTRVQAFERGAVARFERAQKWRDQLSLELPEVVGVLGPQDRELALETANATREIRRELPVPAARCIRASPPGFADRRHDLPGAGQELSDLLEA